MKFLNFTLQYKVLFKKMQSNQIKIFFRISRATLSLALLSALCCLLLIIRAVQTEQIRGLFLLWNLFLAWMPLFFALFARRLSSSLIVTKSKQLFVLVNLVYGCYFFRMLLIWLPIWYIWVNLKDTFCGSIPYAFLLQLWQESVRGYILYKWLIKCLISSLTML